MNRYYDTLPVKHSTHEPVILQQEIPMWVNQMSPLKLNLEECKLRQQRLAKRIRSLSLKGALISDRRHIFYLSKYWRTDYHASLFYLNADGDGTLSLLDGVSDEAVSADQIVLFQWQRKGTLIPDPYAASFKSISFLLPKSGRLGTDCAELHWLGGDRLQDISPTLLELRRTDNGNRRKRSSLNCRIERTLPNYISSFSNSDIAAWGLG